jgi:hypothetical protein
MAEDSLTKWQRRLTKVSQTRPPSRPPIKGKYPAYIYKVHEALQQLIVRFPRVDLGDPRAIPIQSVNVTRLRQLFNLFGSEGEDDETQIHTMLEAVLDTLERVGNLGLGTQPHSVWKKVLRTSDDIEDRMEGWTSDESNSTKLQYSVRELARLLAYVIRMLPTESRAESKLTPAKADTTDPQLEGLNQDEAGRLPEHSYQFWTWSAGNTPESSDIQVYEAEPVDWPWFSQAAHQTLVEQYISEGAEGAIGWLVELGLPMNEGETDTQLRLGLAPAHYANMKATQDCLASEGVGEAVMRSARRTIRSFVTQSPPGPVFASVAIVNAQNEVLLVKRSDTVSQERGLWQVGGAETMQWRPDESEGGKHDKNVEALIRRGLREEFGFLEEHYGNIVISSLSYCLTFAGLHVLANVRTPLSVDECLERRESPLTEGHWEEADRKWVPITDESVSNLIERQWDPAWVPRTSMILHDLRRVLNYLT